MSSSYIVGLLVEQRLSELREEAERERLGRSARAQREWRARWRHRVPLRRHGLHAAAPRPV